MSRDILVRVGEDDKPVGYPTPAIDKLARATSVDAQNDLLLIHKAGVRDGQMEAGVKVKDLLKLSSTATTICPVRRTQTVTVTGSSTVIDLNDGRSIAVNLEENTTITITGATQADECLLFVSQTGSPVKELSITNGMWTYGVPESLTEDGMSVLQLFTTNYGAEWFCLMIGQEMVT